ncbi:MAG: hypothetical protein B6245_11590 [Desulfobacteraceae bacterium 4572_88]|nr:MAG: hypothetical protein B6245_11590 [Desulfobacteraceae bacterium 4572_88]
MGNNIRPLFLQSNRFSMAFLFKFVKGKGIVKIRSTCQYFVWVDRNVSCVRMGNGGLRCAPLTLRHCVRRVQCQNVRATLCPELAEGAWERDRWLALVFGGCVFDLLILNYFLNHNIMRLL